MEEEQAGTVIFRVPYDQFTREDSLIAFFRKADVRDDQRLPPSRYAGNGFEDLCDAFSKEFELALYLISDDGSRLVFNKSSNRMMVMQKTPMELLALSGGVPAGREFSQYLDLPMDIKEGFLEGEEESEGSMDTGEFTTQGWHFTKDLGTKLLRNIKVEDFTTYVPGTRPPNKPWDLFIKLNDNNIVEPYQVCCFSEEAKVVFTGSCVLFKRPFPVLYVEGGLGVALIQKAAADLYVLDRNNRPVMNKLNLFRIISSMATRWEDSGVPGIFDSNIMTYGSITRGAVQAVAQNFRATSFGGGECLYTFSRPEKKMLEYTASLDEVVEMVDKKWLGYVINDPASPLIMTVETLGIVAPALVEYAYKGGKSVVEMVVEQFRGFLLKVGHKAEMRADEEEDGYYDIFVNVNNINTRLRSTEGTLTVDTRPLQSVEKLIDEPLVIVDWKEEKTGIIYPIPSVYFVTQ